VTRAARLVIFDVDGTLVDSQADILAAMSMAFASVDVPVPDKGTVLGIVGLSLNVAIPRLAPDLPEAAHDQMVKAYKEAYMTLRSETGAAQSSPLYPGAMDTLRRLQATPGVILGIATGKSRRGLDKLIEGHDLNGFFATQQVADFHPSKPHPSMILEAMAETAVEPTDTVMIGDTSFDMEMARAAGVRAVGVSWGYHRVDQLADAHKVVGSYDDLEAALADLWSVSA